MPTRCADYVSEKPAHERTDDIVDFGRGKVQLEVGGQMYDADVVVGTKKDGSMLLYDFVGMTKKEMQRTAGRQSAPHDSRAASLSDTSVAQSNASVNLFSVRLAPPFFFRHVQIGAEQFAHKAIDGQAFALRVGFYIVPSPLGDVDCQSVIAFYIPAILNCRRCFAHRFTSFSPYHTAYYILVLVCNSTNLSKGYSDISTMDILVLV